MFILRREVDMRILQLKRIASDNDGTYGVLLEGTKPLMLTLEESWHSNEKEISCIPTGRYLCKRVNSPHFGNTFEVTDVKDREHILFHSGNHEGHTKGCILLGLQYGELQAIDDDTGKVEEQTSVLHSKAAFSIFMSKLKDNEEFEIWIRWS
jgi:hypothetical protein